MSYVSITLLKHERVAKLTSVSIINLSVKHFLKAKSNEHAMHLHNISSSS